jgi:hypothetical protein
LLQSAIVSDLLKLVSGKAILPALVERIEGAAKFAWEELFFAEHHNPYTRKVHQSAVRQFLAGAEGERAGPASISVARRRK